MGVELKELEFKFEDIQAYTQNGIFKKIINFGAFLKKSGTLRTSLSAFWNLHVKSFHVSFSLGNDFLMNIEQQNLGSESDINLLFKMFQDKFAHMKKNIN